MTRKEIKKACDNFITAHKLYEVDYGKLADALEDCGYTVIEFARYDNEADTEELIELLHLDNKIQFKKSFIYAAGDYRLIFVREDLGSQEKLLVLSQEAGRVVLNLEPDSGVVQDEFDASTFADELMHQSGLTHFRMGLYHHRWGVALTAGVCLLIILIGGIIFFRTSKIVFIGNIPEKGTDGTGTTEETASASTENVPETASGTDTGSAKMLTPGNTYISNVSYLSGSFAQDPEEIKEAIPTENDTEIIAKAEPDETKETTETETETDTETEKETETETEATAPEQEAHTAQPETVYVKRQTVVPAATPAAGEPYTASAYLKPQLPAVQETETIPIVYEESSYVLRRADDVSGVIEGTNATWKVSGTTLYIEGTGSLCSEMVPYKISRYIENEGNIYIPAFIQNLPADHIVTSAVIGEGITDIPEGMFASLHLQNITLPSTLEKIYSYAFYDQGGTIALPDSVKYIDDYAFFCYWGNYTGEINSEYIGKYAFWGCNNFSDIRLGDKVKYIKKDAFGIGDLYLSDNIEEIDELGIVYNIYAHKNTKTADVLEKAVESGQIMSDVVNITDKFYWE